VAEVHQEVAGDLCCPGTVRTGGDADQAGAAGAVLDHDLPDCGGRDRWPSLTSSPCSSRCPQAGFSFARRITSLRIAVAVDGRSGPRRRFV
jgi:hypothetical protein